MPEDVSSRIAWFTPLRPISSGISLYNEELLEVVARVWPVDVFVDDYKPRPFRPLGKLRIFPARQFAGQDRRENYAAVVYQFGNSPAHAYMYQAALERPGIVVLHDTVLHHLRLSMVTRRGGARRYREAMAREYGEQGAAVAVRVLQGRLPGVLFDCPLSEEIIRAAQHVVVHSEFSREQVRALEPGADVSVLPMGIRIPPLIDQRSARSALSLPPDAFIVASVTAINPYKRLDVVLRAISRLRRDVPVYMILAGSVSSHVPIERWIGLYGLNGLVEQLGFVDDRTARLVAAAADVLVNLRYPTAGETSASLLRLMAAGRPVLVSDAGSFREVPDDAVVKVPVDALEEDTVEALLRAMHARPDLARQVGANARRFIEQNHTLNHMVAAYHRVLSEEGGLDLVRPDPVDCTESIDLDMRVGAPPLDPLVESVGVAMVELGLGANERLQREVAGALAELGLAPDKM